MSVNMLPTVSSNTAALGKRSSLEDSDKSGFILPPVVEDSLRRMSSSDCSVSTTTTMITLDDSASTKRSMSKGNRNNRNWEESLEALIAYKQLYGHSNVPYYWETDRNLGEWVNRQRKLRSSLPQNQKDLLDSIGFDWQSTQERTWNDKFLRLCAFFQQHGHASVPCNYDAGGSDLRNWISKQRQIYVQGRLSKDRFDKLSCLNLNWRYKKHAARVSPKEEQKWQEKYQRLVAYKDTFGNCAVPFQYEHDKPLGRWVNEQRTQNTRGLLRADRKEILEQVGFLWRINKNSDANPAAKIKYPEKGRKRKAESKQGPQQSSAEDFPAQSKPQKRSKNSQKAAPVIVSDSDKDNSSLVSCGSYEVLTPPLAYDPRELDFDLMISRLESFRLQYGHEEVPPDYSALALGPWLVAMKAQARAGKLPDDQAQRLKDTGIVLIHGESQIWLECFWELRDFNVRFGHSQVSELDNPALAAWATVQRRRDRLGKLSETRKNRLKKIGFEFEDSACIGKSPSSSLLPKHTSGIEKDDLEASELEVDLLAAATSWIA